MRILLDECMPLRLTDSVAFRGHDVDHVTRVGLSRLSNGQLHEYADGRYDLFVTSDRHFRSRADLAPTPTMGTVYVRISPNVLKLIEPALEELARRTNIEELVGRRAIVRRDGWEVL